jgi:hypothetical protein
MFTKKYKKRARNSRKRGGAALTPKQTPRRSVKQHLARVTYMHTDFPPDNDMRFFDMVYQSCERQEGMTCKNIRTINEQAEPPSYSDVMRKTTISSGRDIFDLMKYLKIHREIISQPPPEWETHVELFKRIKAFYSIRTGHKFSRFGTYSGQRPSN